MSVIRFSVSTTSAGLTSIERSFTAREPVSLRLAAATICFTAWYSWTFTCTPGLRW